MLKRKLAEGCGGTPGPLPAPISSTLEIAAEQKDLQKYQELHKYIVVAPKCHQNDCGLCHVLSSTSLAARLCHLRQGWLCIRQGTN